MDCSTFTTLDADPSPVSSARTSDISANAPSLDQQIVKAFRNMEAVVNDAFYASNLLSDTLDRHFGNSRPSDGCHTFELSDLEWNTLFYAVNQAVALADANRRQYYAAYEDVPTQGTA